MKIVLDTNVLLQAVSPRNPFRVIFDAVLDEKINLVVSTEIMMEYEELLYRHRAPAEAARLVQFCRLAPNVLVVSPTFRFRLPYADPDDQKFVDAYVAGHADYLVSNDRHLAGLSAAGFPAVRGVSAEAFLALLAG